MDPYLASHTKMDARWTKDLNVGGNIIKLLKKKYGKSIMTLDLAIIS